MREALSFYKSLSVGVSKLYFLGFVSWQMYIFLVLFILLCIYMHA